RLDQRRDLGGVAGLVFAQLGNHLVRHGLHQRVGAQFLSLCRGNREKPAEREGEAEGFAHGSPPIFCEAGSAAPPALVRTSTPSAGAIKLKSLAEGLLSVKAWLLCSGTLGRMRSTWACSYGAVISPAKAGAAS